MPKKSVDASGNGKAVALATGLATGDAVLPAERCLEIYRLMMRSRALEEREIKMSKSGEGYFWIGGPGEEAFNTVLGLQVQKGEGPEFDYLHLHYRNSATLVAMGMPLIEGIRQMAMKVTDKHSFGRNFSNHFSMRKWNVIPVSSVIEIQFAMAPGTAIMQKRCGGDGVTIVVGGEAGTAEGDFASCMIWSSRPGNEVPVLMIVMNNGYGISTPACSQHGERHVINRGEAFGIPGEVVDGNDPVASWFALEKALAHCRKTRKPYMLEATVSRLHGHSSSSGAARVGSEQDCLTIFQKRLLESGIVDRQIVEQIRRDAYAEADQAADEAVKENPPTADDVYRFTYADSGVDAVYPGDYTGLPGA